MNKSRRIPFDLSVDSAAPTRYQFTLRVKTCKMQSSMGYKVIQKREIRSDRVTTKKVKAN